MPGFHPTAPGISRKMVPAMFSFTCPAPLDLDMLPPILQRISTRLKTGNRMRVISIQEALNRKSMRQEAVKELQMEVAGHCAHIGKISPGCYSCFAAIPTWGVRLGEDAGLPNVCNCDCVHCFRNREVRDNYAPPGDWVLPQKTKESILTYFLPHQGAGTEMAMYAFSGVSEPLFYLPVIRQYMKYFREEIETNVANVRGWAKLYTNGTLLTEATARQIAEMGIQEIRVNPSASGFSPQVYRHIEAAARIVPVVSVEVPCWPLYRKHLFDMLPILDAIGVRHLNICQIEIMTREGLRRIADALPDGEVYQSHWMMLDDQGLVEELLREVADQHYGYSVLDCNALVKQVYANVCFKHLGQDLQAIPAFEELCSTERWPARVAGRAGRQETISGCQ